METGSLLGPLFFSSRPPFNRAADRHLIRFVTRWCGLRLEALVTYLHQVHHVGFERLQTVLLDVFGITLSLGGEVAMVERAGAARHVPPARHDFLARPRCHPECECIGLIIPGRWRTIAKHPFGKDLG